MLKHSYDHTISQVEN